jgi:hypothetical protein
VADRIPAGWRFAGAIHELRRVGSGWQFDVSNSKGERYWITASPDFIELVDPVVVNPYAGKQLVALRDVNYYTTQRWTNPTGVLRAGNFFSVVEAKVVTQNSEQWRVRNANGAGPFYLSARTDITALR